MREDGCTRCYSYELAEELAEAQVTQLNLAEQVLAVPHAHRLKELGVPQSALFFWQWTGDTFMLVRADEVPELTAKRPVSTDPEDEPCAAFTVAELGEILRDCMEIPSFNSHPDSQGNWICQAISGDKVKYSEAAHTEADARAKLLIYLLENKLIALPRDAEPYELQENTA